MNKSQVFIKYQIFSWFFNRRNASNVVVNVVWILQSSDQICLPSNVLIAQQDPFFRSILPIKDPIIPALIVATQSSRIGYHFIHKNQTRERKFWLIMWSYFKKAINYISIQKIIFWYLSERSKINNNRVCFCLLDWILTII
jgi:hypothetical protein